MLLLQKNIPGYSTVKKVEHEGLILSPKMECAGTDRKAKNHKAFYVQIILSCVSGYRNIKKVNKLGFRFYRALSYKSVIHDLLCEW